MIARAVPAAVTALDLTPSDIDTFSLHTSDFSQRSSLMYSMHEALSRDRMRQYEEQAHRSSLLREARSASRSRRHSSRRHAVMRRRSESAGRLLAMAE